MLFIELLFNVNASDFKDLTLLTLAAFENIADHIAQAYFFSANAKLSHFSSYLQTKVSTNKTLKE